MPIHDDLGTRMKTFYEEVPKTRLTRRTPVAIRIDGKAFHTFTRGFDKPFDEVLGNAMVATMKYLCENIQGCVFGYTQSDEITLILIDYQKLTSSAWFDYEVQKMCSIAASMATMEFNRQFNEEANEWYFTLPVDPNKDELW
jgi:tRNA(His) 5'-end guanylyltransferase